MDHGAQVACDSAGASWHPRPVAEAAAGHVGPVAVAHGVALAAKQISAVARHVAAGPVLYAGRVARGNLTPGLPQIPA